MGLRNDPASEYPTIPAHSPWRGQMAKAWRRYKQVSSPIWSRPDADANFIQDAARAARAAWHHDWYEYGRSLREDSYDDHRERMHREHAA